MNFIRYGVTAERGKSALHLDVDWNTNDERWRMGGIPLFRARDYLIKEDVLWLRHSEGTVSYMFDLARIGRRRIPERRDRDITATTHVLATVGSHDGLGKKCPELGIAIGLHKLDMNGRLGMLAAMRWPDEDAATLQERTSKAMRAVAKDLRYLRGNVEDRREYSKHIDHTVFAQVDRERGVTLDTLYMGSCAIDTDGQFYKPSNPTFEMAQHNIYQQEQQLILFAGAASLAGFEQERPWRQRVFLPTDRQLMPGGM